MTVNFRMKQCPSTLARACAALAIGVVGACVSAPATTSSDPAGCWYFERDPAAAELNLPWGIRLLTEPLPDAPADPDARLARTLNADGPADHPFGYWAPVAGDSVVIGYPAGGGLVLRLLRGDTSMSGIARPVGDVMTGPRPDRTVRLTRAACPS